MGTLLMGSQRRSICLVAAAGFALLRLVGKQPAGPATSLPPFSQSRTSLSAAGSHETKLKGRRIFFGAKRPTYAPEHSAGAKPSRRGRSPPRLGPIRPSKWTPTEERREPWRPPLWRPAKDLSNEPDEMDRRPAPRGRPQHDQLQERSFQQFRPPATGRRHEEQDDFDPDDVWEVPKSKPQKKPLRVMIEETARVIDTPVEKPSQKLVVQSSEVSSSNISADNSEWTPKLNLFDLTPDELRAWVIDELEQPRFRASQLLHWMYNKGAENFTIMREVPKALRQRLASMASIGADWEVMTELQSSDGTFKRAYRLPDGLAIESVLMPYQDGRYTACISTQVGCAMGCVFCATGQMGFKRHLTSSEIFEQAARFAAKLKREGSRLSNVVLLGMGEPLANYDNVLTAIRRINKELGIGMRKITISTVGLAPQIRRLAHEGIPVTLAVSLHAATDEERSKLLPMNKKYSIASVMEAVRYYQQNGGRRVSFEWTLIEGQNDGEATAHKLGQLIKKEAPGSRDNPTHVNVIPLNPTNGYGGGPTQRAAVARFCSILATYSIEVTVRMRRGIDIDAGCGQLAERAMAEFPQAEVVLEEGEPIEHLLEN